MVEMPFYLYHKYPFNNRFSASATRNYFSGHVVRSRSYGLESTELTTFENRFIGCRRDDDAACVVDLLREESVRYVLYNSENLPEISLDKMKKVEGVEVVEEGDISTLLRINN